MIKGKLCQAEKKRDETGNKLFILLWIWYRCRGVVYFAFQLFQFFSFEFQFSKQGAQISAVCQRYFHILKLNGVCMDKTRTMCISFKCCILCVYSWIVIDNRYCIMFLYIKFVNDSVVIPWWLQYLKSRMN